MGCQVGFDCCPGAIHTLGVCLCASWRLSASLLSAAHGNYPASLAGWVTMCLACEQRFTTRGVFNAHCTK